MHVGAFTMTGWAGWLAGWGSVHVHSFVHVRLLLFCCRLCVLARLAIHVVLWIFGIVNENEKKARENSSK